MSTAELFHLAAYLEIAVCFIALGILLARGLWREYTALGSFLAVRGISGVVLTALAAGILRYHPHAAYKVYFYLYWLTFAAEAGLALWMLFGIFRSTLKPLQGLRSLGSVMLWGLFVLSVIRAFAPQNALSHPGVNYLARAISRVQRGESLLTLCVAAVVFALIHAVGLSYRSREFGITLGLCLLAAVDLGAAMPLLSRPMVYPFFSAVSVAVFCLVMAIWTFYLALPEPRRQPLHLSPNSPLVQWNRIVLNWSDVI